MRSLHDKLAREVMLAVQWKSFGKRGFHPDYGEVFVTDNQQQADLERACSDAATNVVDLLITEGILTLREKGKR